MLTVYLSTVINADVDVANGQLQLWKTLQKTLEWWWHMACVQVSSCGSLVVWLWVLDTTVYIIDISRNLISLPRGLRTLDISCKHFKALLKTYKATALCDILYKRLRNIIFFLLYLFYVFVSLHTSNARQYAQYGSPARSPVHTLVICPDDFSRSFAARVLEACCQGERHHAWHSSGWVWELDSRQDVTAWMTVESCLSQHNTSHIRSSCTFHSTGTRLWLEMSPPGHVCD